MALAPNKQSLLLLKKQKKLLSNGLKLLTEKRSGLVLAFLAIIKKGKLLELATSSELQIALAKYNQAIGFVSIDELLEYLVTEPNSLLEVSKKRVSGAQLENLKFLVKEPNLSHLKLNIASSIDTFLRFFPKVLELLQLKLNAIKIAKEIQKTTRQVANITTKVEENVSQAKMIVNLLNDRGNLEKATLIKIFK